MSEVTRILSAIEHGNAHAAEQLLPLVYDELRQLAAQKLAQEKPGQTLQPTALVHEAYLRLVDTGRSPHWDSRRHFFAAAAEAMRRILVEKAWRKRSGKHGGTRRRVDLDAALVITDEPREDLLDLDELLEQLAAADAPPPSSSSCASSPASRAMRRPRSSASHRARPICSGRTRAPGCSRSCSARVAESFGLFPDSLRSASLDFAWKREAPSKGPSRD